MADLMIEGQDISAEPVLAVVPALNEEAYIGTVLNGLLAEAEEMDLTIVVADGGSKDGTIGIVESLIRQNKPIYLLHNTKRLQSAAINSAVEELGSHATILIRLDAHATYPPRYCRDLLAIQRRTGADSVVVGMHARGASCFQRASAAAQNSILGNGGSAHRNRGAGRWVDHGHHALMTIGAFRAVGGYDESFSHNEDVELDARLVERGFRIFLTGEMSITYYPRRSPGRLFVQYYRFGQGRARNALMHRSSAKIRHFILFPIVPILFLLTLSPLCPILSVPALIWAFVCLSFGALLGIQSRDLCAASAGIAAMVMQTGWSFGFLVGLVRAFRGTGFGAKRLRGGDDVPEKEWG
jgi:succinoglycan biosynthesis protein ExoA